jgi:hypothetical protein
MASIYQCNFPSQSFEITTQGERNEKAFSNYNPYHSVLHFESH